MKRKKSEDGTEESCSSKHDAPTEQKTYNMDLHKFQYTCAECGDAFYLKDEEPKFDKAKE